MLDEKWNLIDKEWSSFLAYCEENYELPGVELNDLPERFAEYLNNLPAINHVSYMDWDEPGVFVGMAPSYYDGVRYYCCINIENDYSRIWIPAVYNQNNHKTTLV